MSDRLIPFVPDTIWTLEQPCRFYGIELGARMTVVRLRTGELWIHSPLEIDEAARREIDAIGPVGCIVAPSRLHYLGVGAFHEQYPEAPIYGSPRLVERQREIPFTGVLSEEPAPEWAPDIDQEPVRGHLFLDEVAFFHRVSRTLILADLMESTHADSPWLSRVAGQLGGIYERPGPPLDMKLTFRDREAARASIRKILSWDFERVIISHGHLIPSGGKPVLQQAYRFLLES